MSQIKSYIKMQLLYYGIEVPEGYDNNHWSHGFRDVSTQLRKWTKKHYKEDYMLLRSIPGIGPIVASGRLSELGDLRRFKNIKQ